MKNLLTIWFAFFLSCFSIQSLYAQEKLDASVVAQAMAQVQHILINHEAFEQASKQSPEARKAAQDLNQVVAGGNSAEIRALAAAIFENLVRDAQGDPELMMKKIQQAQQNPKAFASSWTPEQRKRLSDIAAGLKQR